MKKLNMLIAAAALATPLASFAQAVQAAAVTRASVVADLIRVEKAGYYPAASNDENYPANIQAVEAKIAQQASNQKPPQPETRAQVQDDLARVEKAGYNPFRNDGNYPQDLQAADAKVEAQTAGKPMTAVQPETRAQVRADLIKVETAGFDPFRDNSNYPADLQAAERKVAAQAKGIVVQGFSAGVSKVLKTSVPRVDLPRNPFTDGA